MRTLVLLCLLSAPAFAQSESTDAAPAPPADVPKAEPAPVAQPAPSVAPVATPVTAPTSESAVSLANRPTPTWWLQAGGGAVAGLISVPVSVYLGSWLGSLSNNVYVALTASYLVMALLPSLAVTAAVVGIGNYYSPGRYPFWRVWGVTSLVNVLAVVVAAVAGMNVGMLATVVLFAVCDALVMTGVATPTARWLAAPKNGEPPSNRLASLEPWNPGAAQRWFVPATEVSF